MGLDICARRRSAESPPNLQRYGRSSEPPGPRRQPRAREPASCDPVPPAAYGRVADIAVCRRVYVDRPVKLGVLRRLHRCLPDGALYATEEVTIFTEGEHQVSSQSSLRRPWNTPATKTWTFSQRRSPWRACVVVSSVFDDWPSTLTVVPLAWPVSSARLREASQISPSISHLRSRIDKADADFIAALLRQDGEAFKPILPPCHRDDWAAKVREPAQSLDEMALSPADPRAASLGPGAVTSVCWRWCSRGEMVASCRWMR